MSDQDKPGIISDGKLYTAGDTLPNYTQNNDTVRKLVILGIVFLIVIPAIGGLFSFVFNAPGDYNLEYRDTYTHDALFPVNQSSNILTINLDNLEGDIYINNNLESSDNLYEIQTEVYTNERGQDDYLDNQWNIYDVEETTMLVFEVDHEDFNNERIQYNHIIHLHKNVTLANLDIYSVSGVVAMSLNEMVIEDVSLRSTSGGALASFDNTVLKGLVELDSSSGGLELIIENSELYLEEIMLDVSSGGVDVFDFKNNVIHNDFVVDVESSSGGIEFDWVVPELNHTIEVDMSVSSGGIDGYLQVNPTISTLFDASVSSGSEDVPSDYIGSAGMIAFDLSSSSGGISVQMENL